MKIYGSGTFSMSNSTRVIWDFADGPFETVNSALIEDAAKQGYSFEPLPEPIKEPEVKKAVKSKKPAK